MKRRGIAGRRHCRLLAAAWTVMMAVLATMATALEPALAHHQRAPQGSLVGVAIPAITHGEMLVVARYRPEIVAMAERQVRSDETFRRLTSFVSLQYFACVRGLMPGTLTDEASPFNECAHAYLAGARALLAHIGSMAGAPEATTLQARIAAEIAADPAFGALCSNSNAVFDSGVIIGPDWALLPYHAPTLLTCLAVLLVAVSVIWLLARPRSAEIRD